MRHQLIIEYGDQCGYDVIHNGQSSGGGLGTGEMIEQVLSLTLHSTNSHKFDEGRPVFRLMPVKQPDHVPEIRPIEPLFLIDDAGGGA